MSRRESDVNLPPAHKSKSCTHIFSKGPAFIRENFDRMQQDKKQIMGYEIETKQLWVLSGLLLLFLLSLTGMIAMWFTETFDNVVFSNLAIVPHTKNYEMWVKPLPKPLLKVHIFNYTNVDEYSRRNDEKLNVKELGPYVYEVELERVNLKYNGSFVSYQEQKHYRFMPEMSKGFKQNDRIMVPNIPLLSAVNYNKHMPFLARIGVSGILNSLDAKPFLTLPAHRFIMGYEDKLYTASKTALKLQNIKPYEQFGLVYNTIGVRDDVVTIHTGETDINKVGSISQVNGKSSLSHWSTAECNSFTDATDGSFFPPKLIRNKRPLTFYSKDMCRSFPLVYDKTVKILNDKIPAYRYVLPDNVFDSPDSTPSNQCFCNLDLGECPPQGVLNITECALGAPLFLSFPHFYNADKKLKEGVTGLNPHPKHQSYADLHPTLGYVMIGKTRMQINIQVAKPFGFNQVSMFDDGMMLPIAWMEYTLEEKSLPEDVVGMIFQTTFTLKSLEVGLKYGTLLTMAVTLFGIVMVLKNRWNRRIRASTIHLQTQEGV